MHARFYAHPTMGTADALTITRPQLRRARIGFPRGHRMAPAITLATPDDDDFTPPTAALMAPGFAPRDLRAAA